MDDIENQEIELRDEFDRWLDQPTTKKFLSYIRKLEKSFCLRLRKSRGCETEWAQGVLQCIDMIMNEYLGEIRQKGELAEAKLKEERND